MLAVLINVQYRKACFSAPKRSIECVAVGRDRRVNQAGSEAESRYFPIAVRGSLINVVGAIWIQRKKLLSLISE